MGVLCFSYWLVGSALLVVLHGALFCWRGARSRRFSILPWCRFVCCLPHFTYSLLLMWLPIRIFVSHKLSMRIWMLFLLTIVPFAIFLGGTFPYQFALLPSRFNDTTVYLSCKVSFCNRVFHLVVLLLKSKTSWRR